MKSTQPEPPQPRPGPADARESADPADPAGGRASAPGAAPVKPPPAKPAQALDKVFARDWLAWQSQMVSGVSASAVCVTRGGDDAGLKVLALWPDAEGWRGELREMAARVILRGVAQIRSAQRIDDVRLGLHDLVGVPLRLDAETRAAVVLCMDARPEPQQQAVLRLLQWGTVWLEQRLGRNSRSQAETGFEVVRRLVARLADTTPRQAAELLADELAERLGCERVSIGFGRPGRIQVLAMSHQRDFDARTHLVHEIAEIMDETADLQREILFPKLEPDNPAPSRFHRAFAERYQTAALGSWPLSDGDRSFGAVLLEWRELGRCDRATRDLSRQLLGAAAPLLSHLRRIHRPWPQRLGRALRGALSGVLGPARWRLKLGLLALLAGFASLHLVETDYRVRADARIEGEQQRAVIAPRSGYVAEARLRAGDAVEAGAVLARLDTADIDLQIRKWDSTRDKHRQEYREALAGHDRTAASIAAARVEEAEAQLSLLRDQRRRSDLVAPFAGVVVSGDLGQAIGGPVELGEVLFEVAALDDHRIVLAVDERDIARIEPGQHAELRLAASPGRALALTVERVVPLAESAEGRNRFRVEARFGEAPAGLRPGMAGVARLNAGRESLWWILTHELRERLALWAWSNGLW